MTEGVAVVAALFGGVAHHLRVSKLRREGGYVNHAVAHVGVVGGVGIGHIACGGRHDVAVGVLLAKGDACHDGVRRGKTLVVLNGAVEKRAAVEADGARFHHALVGTHCRGLELKAETEAQRTAVENLALVVAPGIDYLALRVEERCRAAAECGTHAEYVHTLAVVYMVGDDAFEAVALGFLAVAAPSVDFCPRFVVALVSIEFLQHGIADALGEEVVAVTAFAACLQGRTVGAVTGAVVFPGEVVVALLEEAAVDEGVGLGGRAFHGAVSGGRRGSERDGKDEFAVVGPLGGHFIALLVEKAEGLAFERGHLAGVHFCHFAFARHAGGVAHGECAKGRLAARGERKGCEEKAESKRLCFHGQGA